MPVMSNNYYSNTIVMNKRPNPIPESITVSYRAQDRLNKFVVNSEMTKRFVSETY